MRKIMRVFILSLVSILCFCSFFGCANGDKPEKVKQRITTKTGINISDDAEIVYNFYEKGFQSYIQYTYFKFNEEHVGLLEEYSFSEGVDEDFELDFNSFYNSWNWSPVPKEYEASFEKKYFGLRTGNDFLIFYPRENVLIVYLTGF